MKSRLKSKKIDDGNEPEITDSDRISQLESVLAKLAPMVSQHNAEIEKLNKVCNTDKLLNRLDDIGERMLAIIIQDAVCSEVARYNPSLEKKLFRLREKTTEFWIKRDNWTVEEWSDYLENIEEAQE